MEKLLTIIDGPRLTLCNFVRKQIKNKSKKRVAIHCNSYSKIGVDDRKGMLTISWFIESNSAGVPFKFQVEVEGLFKMKRKVTKKEIIEAAKMEAGSLLFVALRDIVSDLTRKAQVHPLFLSYPDFASLKGVEKESGSVLTKKTKSLE